MAKSEESKASATTEKVGFEVLGVYVKGQKVREYAVALHGPRTAEYAESYAKKLGGEVRKVR